MSSLSRTGHRTVTGRTSLSVASPSTESASTTSKQPQESLKSAKTKYDTWSQAEQQLLVQLWAENHEWLESRESKTAWTKIVDELNSRCRTKCQKILKNERLNTFNLLTHLRTFTLSRSQTNTAKKTYTSKKYITLCRFVS